MKCERDSLISHLFHLLFRLVFSSLGWPLFQNFSRCATSQPFMSRATLGAHDLTNFYSSSYQSSETSYCKGPRFLPLQYYFYLCRKMHIPSRKQLACTTHTPYISSESNCIQSFIIAPKHTPKKHKKTLFRAEPSHKLLRHNMHCF